MFSTIASFMIFGLPLLAYLGIAALICLLFTALISILNRRKIRVIPMKWHSRMAYVTITVALIHGCLGLLTLLGL